MPIYRYTAFNRRGKEEKGIIDAANPAAARKILKLKGLFVKQIEQDREKKERELFPFLTKLIYRVPRRDVALFARQLGTLLEAGLPVDRSLANIIDTTENEPLKKAMIEIRADVIEGEPLSEALRKHGEIFPPLYHNLVSVGEKTGTYEQSMLRLADLEEANLQLRNKVTTALFYPIIMLTLLGSIIIFLLAVVFPQIQAMFVQMNVELPLITRMVIGASNIMTSWLVLIPIAIFGFGYYGFVRWKATPAGRLRYEGILLRIPFVGGLIRKVILTRFSRNLGVMLKSRVPLITALQVVSRVVDHAIFENELNQGIEKIKEGSSLTDSIRDSTIVTAMLLGMLSAGESSDRVPEMVERIADVLDDDLDATIQKLSTLLEPFMMVVMGGVIVVMMVSIMLPMYNLTQQMQF